MDIRTDSVKDILEHYGIPRRSGRYPFGSGERPYQHRDIMRNPEFDKAESNVRKRLSNNYSVFNKQNIDIPAIKSRSGLTDNEAVKCGILAEKKFKEASKREPKITYDVVQSVAKTGSKMYGLEYRLKQPTSMAGKIGSDARSENISFEEASRNIKDVIRYTVVSDTDNFVKKYNNVKSNLESRGYSESRCKNFFERYKRGESMHKAVQCTYKTPDGYEFELQFQTPASQAAKELKIPIYEERRRSDISQKRALELEAKMRELAENVEDPPNISDIQEKRLMHMDLKIDSVNDILKHYGLPHGLGKIYLGEILSHADDTKIRQREAYGRLVDALIEKANKQLEEMKEINKSVWKIQDTILSKTNKDKNANVNGLLQRKQTYLTRQAAKYDELKSTIAEAKDTLKKMKYSSLDALRGMPADEKGDRLNKLNVIDATAKTFKIFPN